jgi:hypothetical protein
VVSGRKTIGILTFHRSHNCGSILQSYAMQEVLKDIGCLPEFIDFSTDGQKELYSITIKLKFNSLSAFAKSIYRSLIGFVLHKRSQRNWTSYDRYITKHLNLSKKSYTKNSELMEGVLGYDKYLTGSDQVWNVTIDDYDKAYFLNFVHDHPKIAYAASQGAKDIRKYAKNSKQTAGYIKNIDFVSTREENGQKWLKDLTGNSYPVVLDPTLLHIQSTYTKIEEKHDIPGIENNKYIFIYAKPLSRDFMKQIKKYANQNGLKIVIWHNDIWLKRLGWLNGIKSPESQNPGKYLDLIKNAKFVCTSSFHGVAFSTIYRKNFVVLENEGMRAGDDDRMTGFLKRLNLFDRIVSLSQFYEKMNQPVMYGDFEKELKKQQEFSYKFLSSALEANSR